MDTTTTPKGSLQAAGSPSGVEAQVCADIATRQQVGIAKYKTTVSDNPGDLRYWLQHAYEECLDQAVYLRRAMDELPPPPTFHNFVEGMKPAHWSGVWTGSAGDELSVRLAANEENDQMQTTPESKPK